MKSLKKIITTWVPAISLALVGCGGAGGDGSSLFGTNIFGQISTSGGSVSSKLSAKLSRQAKLSKPSTVGTLSVCSVVARSLDDNSIVATGTSDTTTGEYTLSGGTLTSGTTYKITATCGSDVLSSVATADDSSPADKTPVVTNPRSTIIAAQIIQAILSAIETAVGPLAAFPSVQEQVKASILKTIQSIASSIEKTIDEAINSGAMEEPSLSEASQMAVDLDTATTSTAVTNTISTNFEATHEIPATVSGTIDGAKAATSALPGCDNTLPGSVASATLCTAAIAKLMYNVLGFPVIVLKSGGALSAVIAGNCNNLAADFKNATITDLASDGDATTPADYCLVKSNIGKLNRNRGDQQGGGDNGGPYFAETGDMGSGSSPGVLTTIGTKLFANTTYHLSDLDKIIFSHVSDVMDANNGAGMNARLISTVQASSGVKTFYYYNGSSWTNTGWVNTCDQNHDGSASTDPCEMWDLNFAFATADWSSATNNNVLATSIGNGTDVSLGVMAAKFGGTIPSLDSLDDYLSKGKVHIDHNPSGQKEFYVMYSEPAAMNGPGGASTCSDNDPSTPCLGVSGSTSPAIKVNLPLGTIQSDKISRITDIVEDANGKYYVTPIFDRGGFSGAFSFIRVDGGTRFTDQLLHDRSLFLVTDVTLCDGSFLPSAAVGNCQVGYFFNATLDWNTCQDSSSHCPTISIVDGHLAFPLNNGSSAVKQVNIDYDYNQNWQEFFGGGKHAGHSLLASYNISGPQKLLVTVNTTTDVITAASTGDADTGTHFNVGLHYNCPMASSCTVDGFYLVKGDGTVYTRAGSTSLWAANSVCVPGVSGPDCTVTNVVKYTSSAATATYGLASAGYNAIDFDADGGNGVTHFLTAFRHFRFDTGPIANANFKCSGEPFYIDKNASGTHALSCNSADNATNTGFVTFSDDWDYGRWLNDPSPAAVAENRSQYILRRNENGYAFSDPVGTKKLLTTAFNGWFDGAHALNETKSLNSLQVFALMFLFFEEGDGQHKIDNLSGLPSGATKMFGVETPIFSGNSSSLSDQNKAIANGFNKYHQ